MPIIRANFPPPLSAFGSSKVEGTIEIDVPADRIVLIAIVRTKNGRGAVVSDDSIALDDVENTQLPEIAAKALIHDLLIGRERE